MKIHQLLIAATLALGTGTARAQIDSIRFIAKNDLNVGIPITKTEFQEKLSKYVQLMSNWTVFTPEQYVEMARLYNTIGDSRLIKVDYDRMYYWIINVMYLKKMGAALDFQEMKGMSLYSRKYNVWLGDRPFGNNNSVFKVDTTK